MASSDELMTVDHPLAFRPSFSDAWISDVYANEADTLTKALLMYFAAEPPGAYAGEISPTGDSLFFNTILTPTDSGCSNESSAAVSKPGRSVPPIGGRVAKRKPWASKRATTTFIEADAANFRQMVQQVTGLTFDGMPASAVLKAEPLRAIDLGQTGGRLPTALDTLCSFVDVSASTTVAPASGDRNGIAFDSYYSFPTLESYAIN